ncbi:MAG: DUF4230 domain-containing protein [Ruminococcus flavefaciens]
MNKEKNTPIVIWNRLPWIILILIIGILFYFKANEKWIFAPQIQYITDNSTVKVEEKSDGSTELTQKNVPYTITSTEIKSELVGKAKQKKEFIVMEQPITVGKQETKEGLFNASVFRQTQYVEYNGIGKYTIDMNDFSESNIEIDNNNKKIIITLPEPKLNVEFTDMKAYDTSNGILTFGEMDLTPDMQNELIQEAVTNMEEKLTTDETLKNNAMRYAEMSIESLFQPVINTVQNNFKEQSENNDIDWCYTVEANIG